MASAQQLFVLAWTWGPIPFLIGGLIFVLIDIRSPRRAATPKVTLDRG